MPQEVMLQNPDLANKAAHEKAAGLNVSITGTQADEWKPTPEQMARIEYVYRDEYTDMRNKKNQTYPQFNDRSLLDFIDDNDKRLNAYVLPKDVQNKEEWQANFATRAYANKTKALLAATARDIPDMKFEAVTKDSQYDYFAADMAKDLTRYSYQQGNPTVDLFFLGWSIVGRGTVISYEGIQQHSFIKKKIKSFDLLTGDVQFDEVETRSHGDPVSFEIPLQNLLIKNFYIRDIQEQPSLIWWTYYAGKDEFNFEWGKYPNAKYVRDASTIEKDEQATYFHSYWKEAINEQGGRGYLLMRYYNKYQDIYRVVCNGVELYNGPMLWTDITKPEALKIYPFAKEIFEPFAGDPFFYGNSMTNSALGEGDVINTLVNSALDKNYRAMVPPLLIGMVNKDMFDLDDDVVAGDTKIYVDDIQQVKQMEIDGVSDADLNMIKLISNGFDLTTMDPQQEGQAQQYVTARAAVNANENAQALKGAFFMFLESLWLQKTRLRLHNILLTYTKPQYVAVLGADGEKQWEAKYRTFNIPNTKLAGGQTGTLSVAIAGTKKDLNSMRPNIEQEEARMAKQGKPFQKVGIMYNYLESFCFDVQIIPATLWQTSQALAMSLTLEKIKAIAGMFPEYFQANKEKLFRELLSRYDDGPDGYNFPKPMDLKTQMASMGQLNGAPGSSPGGGAPGGPAPAPSTGGGGVVSDITGSDSNNSLAGLMGKSP
jgi:hypothetical protein